MAQQKIFGYANRISVRSGEEITFHVNCDGAAEADAHLVKLIHGDAHEAGPGHIEHEVSSPINGRWQVKKQFTQLGSFLSVADPNGHLALDAEWQKSSMMRFLCPHLFGLHFQRKGCDRQLWDVGIHYVMLAMPWVSIQRDI